MRIDTKIPFSSGPSFKAPVPSPFTAKPSPKSDPVVRVATAGALLVIAAAGLGLFIVLGMALSGIAKNWVEIRAYLLTGIIFFGFWTLVVMLLHSVFSSLGKELKSLIHDEN